MNILQAVIFLHLLVLTIKHCSSASEDILAIKYSAAKIFDVNFIIFFHNIFSCSLKTAVIKISQKSTFKSIPIKPNSIMTKTQQNWMFIFLDLCWLWHATGMNFVPHPVEHLGVWCWVTPICRLHEALSHVSISFLRKSSECWGAAWRGLSLGEVLINGN